MLFTPTGSNGNMYCSTNSGYMVILRTIYFNLQHIKLGQNDNIHNHMDKIIIILGFIVWAVSIAVLAISRFTTY